MMKKSQNPAPTDRPRRSRQKADAGQGSETALALIVGMLREDPELRRTDALRRMAGRLRLCADVPDLAADTLGCGPEAISPALLRMTAEALQARP